jgi:hypothetical protein
MSCKTRTNNTVRSSRSSEREESEDSGQNRWQTGDEQRRVKAWSCGGKGRRKEGLLQGLGLLIAGGGGEKKVLNGTRPGSLPCGPVVI